MLECCNSSKRSTALTLVFLFLSQTWSFLLTPWGAAILETFWSSVDDSQPNSASRVSVLSTPARSRALTATTKGSLSPRYLWAFARTACTSGFTESTVSTCIGPIPIGRCGLVPRFSGLLGKASIIRVQPPCSNRYSGNCKPIVKSVRIFS